MIEPANSVLGRFIYKNFHHEPFDETGEREIKPGNPSTRLCHSGEPIQQYCSPCMANNAPPPARFTGCMCPRTCKSRRLIIVSTTTMRRKWGANQRNEADLANLLLHQRHCCQQHQALVHIDAAANDGHTKRAVLP